MMRKALFLTICLVVWAVAAMAQDADEKYATDLLKAGTKAPDFTLSTPDGRKVSLSQLKGKYVVLEFWASWCPDCRKVTHKMDSLATLYSPNDVDFVGISHDFKKEAWVDYITNNVTSPGIVQVSDLKKMKESEVAKQYHVKWIPSFYIIDKRRRVVLGTVEIDKLGKKLAELVQLSSTASRLKRI